jgi:hypothetical protein
MREAQEIIELSQYKEKTKNKMQLILKQVARQSLEDVKEAYGEEFGKYMKKFNELGISPITIQKRADVDRLYNPIFCIEHHNKNYN